MENEKIKPEIELSEEDRAKLHDKILEIFIKFDDFCKKNGFTYYLVGGTLLGAVRHKGFIPWDDDLDVAMPVDDFNRFIELDPKSISDDTFIQSIRTDPEYHQRFAKVRADNTVFKEYAPQNFKIHHGVYVDVFPIDGVPDDPKERNRFVKAISTLSLYRIVDAFPSPYKGLKKTLSHFYHRLKSGRYMFMSPRRAIKARNEYYETHPNANSKQVMVCVLGVWFDRVAFGKPVYREFEGINCPCPQDTDHFLKTLYGDYMSLPPENERVPKHSVVEFKIN